MRYLLVLTVFSFFFYQVRALDLKLNGFNYDKRFDLQVNQSKTIKCDVVNNSNTETLIWYRGTQQVDIKPENSLNTSVVCLPAVAPDDNGISFTCLLKSDTTIKRSVQLNVLFEPILTGGTKTITQVGQNVQLTCGFKANPAVAMSWRQNYSIVSFPSRFEQHMSSNTWTLSITKVEMSDTANYTCVAITPSGNVTTLTFELIVGERQPGLPVEAIGGAVVVGFLIICFGLFARREKIFKQGKTTFSLVKRQLMDPGMSVVHSTSRHSGRFTDRSTHSEHACSFIRPPDEGAGMLRTHASPRTLSNRK